MRGTEERKATTQFTLSRMEPLSHRPAPRSKSLKEGLNVPAHQVVSLNSSDGLIMLYGHPVATRIVLQDLVDRALTGHSVVYLDGVHTFDPLLIGRLARGRRQPPRKALAMIHVARAFSTRQLERLMSHCLAGALERYQASTAVISGLLESISADCLTDKEINRLTDRMIESMRHLIQQGFLLLCPCPSVPMPMAPAYRLFGLLRSMSQRCIRVYEVHGKVVTKEISFDAIPIHTESFEDIRVDSSLPFQSTDQCAFSAR